MAAAIRLIIQAFIAGLAAGVIGLIIKSYHILEERSDEVAEALPGGNLDKAEILGWGISLLVISALVLLVNIFLINIIILSKMATDRFRRISNIGAGLLGLLLFLLTPVILGITIVVARHQIRASAFGLPDEFVKQLIEAAGRSMNYRSVGQLVAAIVCGWVLWLFVLIGMIAERSFRTKNQT